VTTLDVAMSSILQDPEENSDNQATAPATACGNPGIHCGAVARDDKIRPTARHPTSSFMDLREGRRLNPERQSRQPEDQRIGSQFADLAGRGTTALLGEISGCQHPVFTK